MPRLDVKLRAFEALHCGWKPLLKIFLCHREGLRGRLRFWFRKFAVLALVERDPLLRDIDEEVATVCPALVHFMQRMEDEVDWGFERLGD